MGFYDINININGPLTSGANIGVTLTKKDDGSFYNNDGVFTTNYTTSSNSRAPATFFTSDDPNYIVTRTDDGKEAQLTQRNNRYVVLFNANGGTPEPEAQTVSNGGKVTEPTSPSMEGYTFAGWYKEAACTNAWNFTNDTVASDTTLYAKWTQIPEYKFTSRDGRTWKHAVEGH